MLTFVFVCCCLARMYVCMCYSGFYTPTGIFTVAGIHFLPIYLYFWQYHPDNTWFTGRATKILLLVPVFVLALGRLLGMLVEVCGCLPLMATCKLEEVSFLWALKWRVTGCSYYTYFYIVLCCSSLESVHCYLITGGVLVHKWWARQPINQRRRMYKNYLWK